MIFVKNSKKKKIFAFLITICRVPTLLLYIQRLDRKYQRLCRYEDETMFFVARIKASLESGEELDNDDFVVIEAVEDCTIEMSLRLREAEILEKCMSRTL